MNSSWFVSHRKAIVAVVGALVVAASAVFGDNNPAVNEVVAVLTALGVYATPNQ